MKTILFIVAIPLLIFSDEISLSKIHDMVRDARDVLTGNVIDIYYEYTFVGSQGGSSAETHHIIVYINENEGTDHAGLKIYYNSSYETPEFISGRTIKPNGTVVTMGKESTRTEGYLEAIDLNLYTDHMVFVLTPPSVQKGAIVEMIFKVTTSRYPMQGEFWSHKYVQRQNALWRWKCTVKIPAEKNIDFVTLNYEGEPVEIKNRNVQEFTFTGGPHKDIELEMYMPSPALIVPRIAFSTLESYDEFSTWYWGEIEQKIDSNKDMLMTVAALTYKTDDKLQQVKDICRWVSTDIRYVALEFHETAYIPTPASEVFECSYGDCKDKTALLISLLKIIGVDAHFVLVNGEEGGQEITDIPVFDQFDHAIVYIPEYDIWFDPSLPFAQINQLSSDYQDRNALVISGEGYAWRRTPIIAADENTIKQDVRIKIRDNGDAEIWIYNTFTGILAMSVRAGYATAPKKMWNTTLRTLYAATFPNVSEFSCDFTGIDSVYHDVVCSVYVYSENFAKKIDDMLLFTFPITSYLNIYAAALTDREHPIYRNQLSTTYANIVIEFSPEYVCLNEWDSFKSRTAFIDLRITPSYGKGEIMFSMYTRDLKKQIEKYQFTELEALYKKLSKYTTDTIILKRK